MELALSLGDSTKPSFPFLDKPSSSSNSDKDLRFRMGLDVGSGGRSSSSSAAAAAEEEEDEEVKAREKYFRRDSDRYRVSPTDPPPLQLDLLPFSPVPRSNPTNHLRLPWQLPENTVGSEMGFTDMGPGGKTLDANRLPAAEDAAVRLSASPPNSVTSSFQLDFGMRSTHGDGIGKRVERSGSRASDDDENGSTRKKLRLSKEQSAFLEESFKEHNTLNPKQKLALAKQLNLRPRQVEVWFQNRRARTKLKQTEVDCEYLKRCCESLTEENRRLQKELQELRALKTSRPFYMQLPATTLTMCPSCERVATTTATATTTTITATTATATVATTASSAAAAYSPWTSTSSSCPFGPVKAQTQAHQGL